MASAKKQLREYLVAPDFNFAAARASLLPGLPAAEVIAAMTAKEKAALDAIRKPVSDIVKADGGQIKVDGAQFGVKGHPQEHAGFMVVRIDAATVPKIAKLPGVLIGPNGRLRAS